MRLAADHFEDFHTEQRFHFLHRVGNRRLTLVQCRCGLGITAGIDHGQQGTPLFEGNPWIGVHISVQ